MIPSHNPFELTDDTPVYVISVAAQLSGLHPQTLRQYDRLGLVSPDRTAGRGRRYSARDIAMLREVQQLSQQDGVNLAGIKRVLALQDAVHALRRRLAEVETELATVRALAATRASHPRTTAASAGTRQQQSREELLPMLPMPTDTAVVVWRDGTH